MLNFTPQEIDDAFAKVDVRTQDVLSSDWLLEDINLLGKSIGLTVGQVGGLTRVISFTLLDLVPLSKFIENLENEINVSHERATEIAEKTDEMIFSKIREEITAGEAEKKENLQQQIIQEPEIARDELLKEIEEHAKKLEESGQDPEENMDALNEVVSNDLEERIVDPYRESID